MRYGPRSRLILSRKNPASCRCSWGARGVGPGYRRAGTTSTGSKAGHTASWCASVAGWASDVWPWRCVTCQIAANAEGENDNACHPSPRSGIGAPAHRMRARCSAERHAGRICHGRANRYEPCARPGTDIGTHRQPRSDGGGHVAAGHRVAHRECGHTPTPTQAFEPRWRKVGSIDVDYPDFLSLLGFDGGYVIYGKYGRSAWFSSDGGSWQRVSLPLEDERCEYDETEQIETGASMATGVVLLGMGNDRSGGGSCVQRTIALTSADGLTWQRSEPFGPAALPARNRSHRSLAGARRLAGRHRRRGRDDGHLGIR